MLAPRPPGPCLRRGSRRRVEPIRLPAPVSRAYPLSFPMITRLLLLAALALPAFAADAPARKILFFT